MTFEVLFLIKSFVAMFTYIRFLPFMNWINMTFVVFFFITCFVTMFTFIRFFLIMNLFNITFEVFLFIKYFTTICQLWSRIWCIIVLYIFSISQHWSRTWYFNLKAFFWGENKNCFDLYVQLLRAEREFQIQSVRVVTGLLRNFLESEKFPFLKCASSNRAVNLLDTFQGISGSFLETVRVGTFLVFSRKFPKKCASRYVPPKKVIKKIITNNM